MTDHLTINYVDDSTNLVSFSETCDISNYLTDYYRLLNCYYGINKLQINADKTKFTITCKSRLRQFSKHIQFIADGHTIKQQDKIKILRAFIQFNLSYDSHINSSVSKMSDHIFQMNKLKQYVSFKSRLSILNSMVIGVLRYIIPIHLNCKSNQLKKLHVIIMKSAKAALASNCFKISNIKILEKCNWLSIWNLLRYTAIIYIYKIKNNKCPTCIYEYYTINKSQRVNNKTYPIYSPKYANFKKFITFEGNDLYNKIPDNLRSLPYNKFKNAIKTYITSSYHPFKWDYDDRDSDISD